MSNRTVVALLCACPSVFVGVCMLQGCAPEEGEPSARASGRPALEARAGSGASSGSATDSPRAPLLQPSAAAGNSGVTSSVAGCAPGLYRGTYDVGLLGEGPIEFNLVAAQPASAAAAPCQEFCPELVVSSEGGGFSANWFDIFSGTAKLKGGLDCKSGEFRAELVDGRYGVDPSNPAPDVQALGGELTGHFVGRFVTDSSASIMGSFTCSAMVDVDGTFNVQRAP